MRRLLAVALVLSACSAYPPPPVWPETPETLTHPLFAVAQTHRPLIEIQLNGQGPFLFVVDPAVVGGALVQPLAAELGLRLGGDAARGEQHVTVDALAIGDLVLRDVRLQVLAEDTSFGPLFDDRPVAGVLGTHLLSEATLEIDPGAGVLRVSRAASPPPPTARATPLTRRADGRLTVEAHLGDEAVDDLLLSTAGASALDPDRAEGLGLQRLGDPEARVGWLTSVALGGPPTLVALRRQIAGPTDGRIGWDVLRRSAFRVDAREGTLHQWPATPGRRWLERYPASAPCGPALRRCLVGRVERVSAGRVDLAFAAPQMVLPEGWWLTIDVGARGRPLPLLVRLRPTAPGVDATHVAAFSDPRLTPQSVRPAGEPVTVIDVVPLGRACSGHVCLRRSPVSGFIQGIE